METPITRLSTWIAEQEAVGQRRLSVVAVDRSGNAILIPAPEPSQEELRAEIERRSTEWFGHCTQNLLLMARQKEQISLPFIPEGYAGSADYIVVWSSGVWLTDDIDEAVLLKMKFSGQIIRNPDKARAV